MSKRHAASTVASSAAASAVPAVGSSGDSLRPRLNWRDAVARDVEWQKDDLLAVVYWLRQVLGVVLGVVWGLVPITGLAGHLLFAALSALILFMYYTKYLGVDDEDEKYGGRWELIIEGLWPSYALFLITWIGVYSLPY